MSFLFCFFVPTFVNLKKGIHDFVFLIGGSDHRKYDEVLSKIKRFNVRLKIWESLKIEIPQKLHSLFCIVKDGTLHCIGGVNDKEETDSHFSIKMREIYIKNGGLLIFENWFRFYGFKTHTKDLGKIVEEYAGNLW